MKTSLYNQDGSLCSEAQLLISLKPDDVSRKEWIKRLKDFRSQLSTEDLKEFERLRNNKRNARRRAENPEKVKQDRAKWRAENPDYHANYSAKWYAENAEKAKQDNAKWYAQNTEKAKANSAKWYAENAEKAKQDNAKRSAERRAKDPLYRLQHNMRVMGNRVVKQLSLGKKPACTEKWQGCTAEELKAYLESLFTEGMTWENYGEWHVDHIRPICSFTAEEWEQVNRYTNLRPLWAEDNLAKISSDVKQSARNKSNTKSVEVSEQTPVTNKD
jgi:hypothetical protein